MLKNKLILIPIFLSLSFFVSYFVGEDALGGARHDYLAHEKFIKDFSENFLVTFHNYGHGDLYARNSPVFYIIYSKLYELLPNLNLLRYFNILLIFPLLILFYKCLILKFQNIDNSSLILFFSCLLLSPTVRSLTVWPYPLIYALIFFLSSIYFYLNFEKSKNKNEKLKNAFYCILYLSISSYLTPNFAIFILFYVLKFFLEFKFSKEILIILLFSLFLSLPAISFLIWKDFYLFQHEVYEISNLEKFNIANKIVIISSIVFLFFLPFLKKIKIKNELNKFLKNKKIFFILIIFITCVYFFDFKMGAGGGIFYQISNILFKNNLLLFLFFLFSLIIFNIYNLYNFNNFVIFFILIIYNLQYTIYYKYFDPILLFIFLFMFKLNKNKVDSIEMIGKKYFLFYIIFLLINLFKNNIRFILV